MPPVAEEQAEAPLFARELAREVELPLFEEQRLLLALLLPLFARKLCPLV